MRVHSFLGRLALAAGAWVALAGFSEAQNKGRGKGGGGGGGRAPAARSAPAQRSAPQRAPAARSAPAQRAPVVRQAPQQQRAPVVRQAPQQQRAPGVRDRDVDRNPNVRDFNARNRDRDWDRDRDWNRDGDWDRDRWNGNRYWSGRDWDDDDDDFWRYLGYSAAARFLGVPFGNYGFYPYYGGYPYGYGYGYGGYRYPGYYRGYYSGNDGYYDNGYYDGGSYYSEPYYSTAPVQPAGNVAMMRVIVPDPNARVWVQGRETSSRGTERTYNSPPLEPGYEYTYNIRAEWRENGQTMVAERSVSVDPGDRLTVDFTRGPAEAITE